MIQVFILELHKNSRERRLDIVDNNRRRISSKHESRSRLSSKKGIILIDYDQIFIF
jgi:hypothetical protein